MESVGMIGLGNIGLPIARRLKQAGHRLVVHDVRKARCEELGGDEHQIVATPKDVADRTEVVLLSLPTPDVLREVAGGEQGVIHGEKVKLVIDTSTVGPAVTREQAANFAAKEIEYVDAPVSGGVAGAQAGALAIMVAGSSTAFERARSVFEAFGRPIRVGEVAGQAQIMKILNNFLSATAMAATAEAAALGVKAGLDPRTMIDVFNASSGRNTATVDKFPRSVLNRSFNYGFRAALLYKDVKLCSDFADGVGAPLGVITAIEKVWKDAAAALGDEDFTRIVQLAERPLGVVVGREGATS